jgi:hypothetical protein
MAMLSVFLRMHLRVSFGLAGILLVACGGDGGSSADRDESSDDASTIDDPDEGDEAPDAGALGTADAGSVRDSGVRDAATDGAVRADGGTGGPSVRDAGAATSGLASNTPWAPFVWAGTSASDGLKLIASNVTLKPTGGAFVIEWLYVIRNGGTRPLCSAIVRGGFVAADGRELFKVIGTTDSQPHLDNGAIFDCMAPGSSVGGYGNATVTASIDLQQVHELRYSVTGATQPTAVLQTSPTISSSKVTAAGTAVEGTVMNGARSVRFLSYKLYPLDARGMPLKRLMVYHSTETNRADDVFPANTVWNFTSQSQSEPFTTYLLNLDFQL